MNLSKNSVDDDVIALMIKKQKEFSENTFKIGNVVIDKPGLYTIMNNELFISRLIYLMQKVLADLKLKFS